MRRLVLDYAAQHHLAEAGTGLVDIGWTGRMVGSLIQVCEAAGMSRPSVLFWGHEPRPATGWTDPERVAAYMYNTATGQGLQWRVPDAPFVMETFCMGDHGIVSGYRTDAAGQIQPVLLSPSNDAAEAWGLRLYRSTLYAFCAALDPDGGLPAGRPAPAGTPGAWTPSGATPPGPKHVAWGTYPYDSDPAGTAATPARPAIRGPDQLTRGDRAWLAGSLALSTPEARAAFLRHAPADELAGAPETDLCSSRRVESAPIPRDSTTRRPRAVHAAADCGTAVLHDYGQHIRDTGHTRERTLRILDSLTRLWAFDQLSARSNGIGRPLWDELGADDYLPAATSGGAGENATDPIAEQTMAPLLIWAMRLVDDLGDDILAGWAERQRLTQAARATEYHQAPGSSGLHPLLFRSRGMDRNDCIARERRS